MISIMENTILTLDQRIIGPSVDIDGRLDYYQRVAVRAVLKNTSGRIALMYAKQRGYYKLPGGGVDNNEKLTEALDRELLEEVGAKGHIVKELGNTIEWRDSSKMKQISYAYIVNLINETSTSSLTPSEVEEGFEVKWAKDIDEAIHLVESRLNHNDIEVVFMTKRDAAILRTAKQYNG